MYQHHIWHVDVFCPLNAVLFRPVGEPYVQHINYIALRNTVHDTGAGHIHSQTRTEDHALSCRQGADSAGMGGRRAKP
jgi:hypothetical protein